MQKLGSTTAKRPFNSKILLSLINTEHYIESIRSSTYNDTSEIGKTITIVSILHIDFFFNKRNISSIETTIPSLLSAGSRRVPPMIDGWVTNLQPGNFVSLNLTRKLHKND